MQHPVIAAIQRAGFATLGWFEPVPDDAVPAIAEHAETRQVVLIGNAGPAMFERFQREADPSRDLLDAWTQRAVAPLAETLGGRAVYPFDKPPLAFLTWARKAHAGFVSPLGMNIHPVYGLWHAFRAALLFPVVFDLPLPGGEVSPCETCAGRPCLSACPVGAFDGRSYDVDACAHHLEASATGPCMSAGCLARHACPVGSNWRYGPAQARFHMGAFLKARRGL